MSEITFLVESSPEGGYSAKAFGVDIFTEADDLAGLHANVRDAVRCHFDDSTAPRLIRLHPFRRRSTSITADQLIQANTTLQISPATLPTFS